MSMNEICIGYYDAVSALKKPVDAVDWLRNEAAQSWLTIFFGHLFTEVCYLVLLPVYLALTVIFGLLAALTLPILPPIQCCVGLQKEPRTRVLDIFSRPATNALSELAKIMKALFFLEERRKRVDVD